MHRKVGVLGSLAATVALTCSCEGATASEEPDARIASAWAACESGIDAANQGLHDDTYKRFELQDKSTAISAMVSHDLASEVDPLQCLFDALKTPEFVQSEVFWYRSESQVREARDGLEYIFWFYPDSRRYLVVITYDE